MQSKEQALLLWEKLEKVLGIEINGSTDPEEIYRVISSPQILLLLEEIRFLDAVSTIGYSNVRLHRVIYSTVVIGIYSKIVEKEPRRVKEVENYLQERIKDIDRTVRINCIRFILNNSSPILLFCTRKIPRNMINLLKNKNRSVRKLQFKLICANLDGFLSLLKENDGKILLHTLLLVLKHLYFATETYTPHRSSFFADRSFEIVCAAATHKKVSMSEIGSFLCASFLRKLISNSSAKLLSKMLSSEMVKDSFTSKLTDGQSASSPVECASYILKWSILHRKSIFTYYTNLLRGKKLSFEAHCKILPMLLESPYLKSKNEYLIWIETQIDALNDASPQQSTQTLIQTYFSFLSNLRKTGTANNSSFSVDSFVQRIENAFYASLQARSEIIVYFEEIASFGLDSLSSLLKRLASVVALSYPEMYMKLAQSINVFLYLEKDKLLLLINSSNPTNYYIILWYLYLCKKDEAVPSTFTDAILQIKLAPIEHCDIEISAELFIILSFVQKPDADSSFFSGVLVSLSEGISKYLFDCLSCARKSRESLLSSFHSIFDKISNLLSSVLKEDPIKNAPLISLLSESTNAYYIHSLLLYFLNYDEMFSLLSEFLKKICKKTLPTSSSDVERLRFYGILASKTEKRYKLYLSLLKPHLYSETEMSSLAEKTVSTNLDTNIIENISQIKDLHNF